MARGRQQLRSQRPPPLQAPPPLQEPPPSIQTEPPDSASPDPDETSLPTPRRYPSSVEKDFVQSSLEVGRMQLKKDMVGFPLVSFEFFRDHILPVLNRKYIPKMNVAVEKVYKGCVEAGIIVDDKFAAFKKSPSELKADAKKESPERRVLEDAIYASMPELWEDVVKVATTKIKKLRPTVLYTHTPHVNPYKERREGTRPDAVSYLLKSTMPENFSNDSRYYLCNAAVLREDKVSNSPSDRKDVSLPKFIFSFILKLPF